MVRLMEVVGSELAVVWDDGHESYFPLEQLRRECPCASCSGEPDLFGRIARGPAPVFSPAAFELTNLERVGHYGLQPRWGDGHEHGIWTFDRLRAACGCAACKA
ncbi:MAG TPA: DUF971 domain-containing protein [Thermoanaerobaculia bacterium]|nr:DUF971 domain-containing protein [Thermoanaerobaculia bacterium]